MKRIFSILSFVCGAAQILDAGLSLIFGHRFRVPGFIMGSIYLGIGFWLRNWDQREKAARLNEGNSNKASSTPDQALRAYREFGEIKTELKKLIGVTGFLSLLNYALGAMFHDWIRAGFPMSADFLFFYMLTPPLMILDGFIIYGSFRRSKNRIWVAMLSAAYVSAILFGFYFGLPKK